MLKDSASEVIGYYDPEFGDCYCANHARNSHLPIMKYDNDFSNEKCSICGVYLDDIETTESDWSD